MTARAAAARYIQRLLADDSGATVIEYAVIVSIVSIGIGFMLPEIKASIDDLFLRAASAVGAALPG